VSKVGHEIINVYCAAVVHKFDWAIVTVSCQ